MIYIQLFLSFLQVGLFSFGGGYATLPLIQSQIVDAHRWLDVKEFTDLITLSQMTPGPIAINSATFVGIKVAGVPGALASNTWEYPSVLYYCDSYCETILKIPEIRFVAGSFEIPAPGSSRTNCLRRSQYFKKCFLGSRQCTVCHWYKYTAFRNFSDLSDIIMLEKMEPDYSHATGRHTKCHILLCQIVKNFWRFYQRLRYRFYSFAYTI